MASGSVQGKGRDVWLSTQRQTTHPHADQAALPALDTQAMELSTSPGVDILGDVRSRRRDLQQSSMGWGPELRNYLPVISVGCVWGHAWHSVGALQPQALSFASFRSQVYITSEHDVHTDERLQCDSGAI